MKTKEELNELKKKYEEVKNELRQLTDEELKQVVGGMIMATNEYGNNNPPTNLTYKSHSLD
ncbi:MAG: bacteriocin [Clostridia bacterium]|nr:bacteriocin [Clostridia bacterium]